MERPNEESRERARSGATDDAARSAIDRRAPGSGEPARGAPAGGNQTSEEEIRRRAYELYESRGGAPGSDMDDWLAAEREVRARWSASGPEIRPEMSPEVRSATGAGTTSGLESGAGTGATGRGAPGKGAAGRGSSGRKTGARGASRGDRADRTAGGEP